MIIEYSGNLNFSLAIFITDLTVTELVVWVQPEVLDKFLPMRLANFVLLMLGLILLILRQLRSNTPVFKMLVMFMLISRLLLTSTELFVVTFAGVVKTSTSYIR